MGDLPNKLGLISAKQIASSGSLDCIRLHYLFLLLAVDRARGEQGPGQVSEVFRLKPEDLTSFPIAPGISPLRTEPDET